MAWDICITDEGWKEVYDALAEFDKWALIEAIEDDMIEAVFENGCPIFADLSHAQQMKVWREVYILWKYAPVDALVDRCFDLIQANNTCDNGGWEYWIDRRGYHTVRP